MAESTIDKLHGRLDALVSRDWHSETLISEFFNCLENGFDVGSRARVHLEMRQLKPLLESGSGSGVLVFEELGSGKGRLEFAFSLETLDCRNTVLRLAGHGVDQLIGIRSHKNTGKTQYRFHCARCDKGGARELFFFHGGRIPEFLCGKCPEEDSYWAVWRCRGGSYQLAWDETERIRFQALDL